MGCMVEQHCYDNDDCSSPKICNQYGSCEFQCQEDSECGPGFICQEHRCEISGSDAGSGDGNSGNSDGEPPLPLECPAEMVLILNTFCIDIYEASRQDSTKNSSGSDNSKALSQKGVFPWQIKSNQEAEIACNAAGKRLCTSVEWQTACKGKDKTEYAYGDQYEPKTCNGIDAFEAPEIFHLAPTGSFPDCHNGWGVYDLNGNVWEHTQKGSGKTVRGGAFNCSDSAKLHKCDYIPGNWTPAALGFRCCATPQRERDSEYIDNDAGIGDVGNNDDSSQDQFVDGGVVVDYAAEEESSFDEGGITEDENTGSDGGPGDTSLDSDSGLSDDLVEDGGTTNDGGTGDTTLDSDSGLLDDLVEDGLTDSITTDSNVKCPPDMALVNNFCIDLYEASRSDATENHIGNDTSGAYSRPGVIPWFPVTRAIAQKACAAAGKRLCKSQEWLGVCQGSKSSNYSYGDKYDPAVCNGIDKYCYCHQGSACQNVTSCPYPHCYHQASSSGNPSGGCGANFHVDPTGNSPNCASDYGVYDLNGNVWEVVDHGDNKEHFRGGAYNCYNSEQLHRCDYDADWGPSAKGFRCCKDLN